MASLCSRKNRGPQKVGSSQGGVKTARLQAVSQLERDFLWRGGTVKVVSFCLLRQNAKNETCDDEQGSDSF